MDTLRTLQAQGQSVWLDFIRRKFVQQGEFAELVGNGVTGVTSNPTIFEKAIDGTEDYAAELDLAARTPSLDPTTVYETLALKDVGDAADLLRPVYDATGASDGYASLEVSPHLAYDLDETLAEARRLWAMLGRPNVMIKVPATPAGRLALPILIEGGINVNVTLLFGQDTYESIAEAYLEGLERRLSAQGKLDRIASVASFFVSRIDARVDALLKEREREASPDAGDFPKKLSALYGKVAIANAKLAYQRYERIFSGPRWEALRERGARSQRLLWASTSTKNPSYPELMYVEELVGPNTVNTLPLPTLTALRDHGRVRPSLKTGIAEAEAVLQALPKLGISLPQICEELVRDGVAEFANSLDKVLAAIERARVRRSPSGPSAVGKPARPESAP